MKIEDDRIDLGPGTWKPTAEPVQQAIQRAETLFAHEKAARLASDPGAPRPMKSLFLTPTGDTFALAGLLFNSDRVDEKDQHALAVRLVAYGTDSWAVVDIAEGWSAQRCASCGAVRAGDQSCCPRCDASATPPSENLYRREMLLTVLHVRTSTLNYAWAAEAQTGAQCRLVAWRDECCAQAYPANPIGRFEMPCVLDSWMVPHFVVNRPQLAQYLERTPDPHAIELARYAEAHAPAGYPLLRIVPAQLATALRQVDLDAIAPLTGELTS